jgi:hypothetical protein
VGCQWRVAYLGKLGDAAGSFGNNLGGHLGGCDGERLVVKFVVGARIEVTLNRLVGRRLLPLAAVGRCHQLSVDDWFQM